MRLGGLGAAPEAQAQWQGQYLPVETPFCNRYVRPFGCPCEEYSVRTSDGFVLNLQRIPGPCSGLGQSLSTSSKPSAAAAAPSDLDGGASERRSTLSDVSPEPSPHNAAPSPLRGGAPRKRGVMPPSRARRALASAPGGGPSLAPAPAAVGRRSVNASQGAGPLDHTTPAPLAASPPPRPKLPVVFDHAVFFGANLWVGLAQKGAQVLPFHLANQGFDVWLLNHRATQFSPVHVTYARTDQRYWEFSFDDLALIDLPAMLAKILAVTLFEKVHFVGYNQGGVLPVVAASLIPEFAASVASMSLVGPICFLANVSSPALNYYGNGPTPDQLFYQTGFANGEYNLSNTENVVGIVNGLLEQVNGNSSSQLLNPSQSQTLLANVTGQNCCLGGSLSFSAIQDPNWVVQSYKNLIHYQQEIKSGLFQAWDFGNTTDNELAYGTPSPPQFIPRSISPAIPIFVISGSADLFADPPNVYRLVSSLARVPRQLIVPKYAHLDLMLSYRVHTDVHVPITDFISENS